MGKPKWEYNEERYPDQRSNWASMSRSQKRYTIDAYNKARANRGVPTIPNPFHPKGHPKILKPGTSLANRFPSFVNVETVTPVSSNTELQYPIGEQPPTTSTQNILDFSDDELDALLRNPQFNRILDKSKESNFKTTVSPISDPLNTPGTSGVTQKKSTTPRTEVNAAEEPPSKKPHIETTTNMPGVSSIPGSGSEHMDIDQHNTTASFSAGVGGSGAASGLSMEKGLMIMDVPRPYNFRMMDGFGTIKNAFSILSYGFATRIIGHPHNTIAPSPTQAYIVCATTPLLEVPWDRVNMYINPGVYNSLPIGSYIKSVHCKIIQRNIRVAFETNQSDSTLATLNQNKFSLIGLGLNNKNDIRVTNMRYDVSATGDTMVPVALSDPIYDDIDECLYGYPQSSENFNGTVGASNSFAVPCVNFSFNTTLHPKNYLVAWNDGYKDPASTAHHKDHGWYNLSQHIRKYPAGKHIDEVIVNESYYPTYAPLKGQLEFAEYLRDIMELPPPTGTEKVPVSLNQFTFTDHDIGKEFARSTIALSSTSDSNPTESQTTITTNRNAYTLQVSRTALIEKGQYYKQIDSNSKNNKYVQPSIHVGCAAVPKLTTDTGLMLTDKFSDVQAYYDVELSMVVGFNYAHQNTYQDVFNVNANEIRMSFDTSVSGQRPTPLLPNRFGHQALY